VVNGLALTCKLHVWHSWEGPETSTGAYGNCCKPAHTVHVVNNFNFNFIAESSDQIISHTDSREILCPCMIDNMLLMQTERMDEETTA
jgi:hypothetical protein